jgi:hypothetical protein
VLSTSTTNTTEQRGPAAAVPKFGARPEKLAICRQDPNFCTPQVIDKDWDYGEEGEGDEGHNVVYADGSKLHELTAGAPVAHPLQGTPLPPVHPD